MPNRFIYFLKIGAIIFLLFIAVIFAFINAVSSLYIKKNHADVPKANTAIVLGAAILHNGQVSQVFSDRLDVGIQLYKEGKVKNILVSGDNGTTTHNEVNPARDYLLARGVPTEDIFLDHAGFDTYSSMYRARDVFLDYSAIVVTQSFHLPRAVFIARSLGIDAYGVPSDQHKYSFRNNVREVGADVKAMFNVIFRTKPKFLGKEIPITGDSSRSI